jgi:hypothetical protein
MQTQEIRAQFITVIMTGTLWPVLKNPTHSWLFFWSATEFK